MKGTLLKYQTKSFLRKNNALHVSTPYAHAKNFGLLFTIDDKKKHEEVKDLVRKLETEGKQVKVMSFLPEKKENHDFLFDFFTEKELSFWGEITSTGAITFSQTPFDYLFYLDTTPNPYLMNILARSKARCRVGKHFEKCEGYFEMMLNVPPDTRALIDAIHTYTSKLR